MGNQKGHRKSSQMTFDERTVENMEVARDRACDHFPKELASHEARKQIAVRILERANRGERTLKGFTDAAIAAVSPARFQKQPNGRNSKDRTRR
jgi:hypothetical protein